MKKVLALVSLVTFISLATVSCGSNSQTEVADSTQVDTTQTDSLATDSVAVDSTK